MKKFSKSLYLLFICAFWFAAGCNKESYIESVGYVAITAGDDTDAGYFIFTSGGAVGQCGRVKIFIDGNEVGYLDSDYSTNQSCGVPPIEGKLLKVVASGGIHKITFSFAKPDCRNYPVQTYTMQSGKCMWYTLN
jgi:hypothetical protein